MVRTKLTVRRWMYPKQARTVEVGADFVRKKTYTFKIKLTLPSQKTVNIKKNEQIVKTINVRRKSKHFSGRSAMVF